MRSVFIAPMLLAVLSMRAVGQSQPPSDGPRFEVASVKPSLFPSDAFFQEIASAGMCTNPRIETTLSPRSASARVTFRMATLCGLIRFAYDLKDYQVVERPAWMSQREASNFYDIEATVNGGLRTRGELLRQMVQNLLTERFLLRTHWDHSEIPIYALVVTQKEPKVARTEKICPDFSNAANAGGPGIFLSCKPETSMSQLAITLSHEVDRAVVDETGLTGRYAFRLTWSPDPTSASADGPSIFTAVQEQLGLKLEPRKTQGQVLVIDNAERPIPN